MKGASLEMRGFICDEMLKKLARWLRMAGYDVLSPVENSDDELVDLSSREDRILLTRDKDLSNRKDANSYRIISDALDEQLIEFLRMFPRENYAPGQTRCALCNGALHYVSGYRIENDQELRNRIPDNVLLYIKEYYRCASCGKLYWKGGHWARISERLDRFSLSPILPQGP
ncbi:MAG: Mut7-C RNAse domain-containing protein [Thermoplasmatota archaeon]